ncbi:MAG: class I SAM-dependent methyltransferase [Planctomyces sp.]|nr:class I SAM-dependent methyltransferase [Planctomyces sp.]
MAKAGSPFAHVASDEECRNPLGTLDSRGWLPPSVRGLKVLCLAAGGGWQSILYASAGAEVTVVDLSPEMLALDEREAGRRGLSVRTIATSMDDLSMLADATFDISHQPVSTCYIPYLAAMYRELARVTKPGGLYISQHKQPVSLQLTHRDHRDRYVLGFEYYEKAALPLAADTMYREPGAQEYIHRWDELVGQLCRSGFALEDLVEPRRADPQAAPGTAGHRGRFVAPYVRLKARRLSEASSGGQRIVY